MTMIMAMAVTVTMAVIMAMAMTMIGMVMTVIMTVAVAVTMLGVVMMPTRQRSRGDRLAIVLTQAQQITADGPTELAQLAIHSHLTSDRLLFPLLHQLKQHRIQANFRQGLDLHIGAIEPGLVGIAMNSLHQRARKQKVGQHHHPFRAPCPSPLPARIQTRMGDATKAEF